MRTLGIGWRTVLHLVRLLWEPASYATVFLCAFFSSRGWLAAEIVAILDASDPEGDDLQARWELRGESGRLDLGGDAQGAIVFADDIVRRAG